MIELRESTGMTRREFCDYFGIPYRTLQDWELGNRKMPDYLLRLMIYKINVEKLMKD
ncbi:helix-turn-helix domain-containing protein [Pseudobutyrivibrio ruminis]|uniref:helix-turn-helix domain-containing protein n=1 Tax=Pseudobutyrivibrio ruminis TaxID=46206 RepID=UPI002E8E1C75|nr:helix-turn-helix domain-containing protein [Pseudobutyrivibrio ruminis]